jgi:cobyrinic acid a,c-diamide synthase
MMPAGAIRSSLCAAAAVSDVAVIEGNRGLFDGLDSSGSHSTAELAKLIGAPVILVVDAAKVTRTVAAIVLGCQALDPALALRGVILNRVGTARQEKVIRAAIGEATGLPVLGSIPRVPDVDLPSRHLGLVTVAEHPRADAMLDEAGELIERYLDVDAVLTLAAEAPPLPDRGPHDQRPEVPELRRVRVGVPRDAAFSFYYPENLEALNLAGAELVEFSPLTDPEVPEVDGLLFGGGFPEVYADRLSANRPMREELAKRIARGLPVWAECGGLMYLARNLVVGGVAHPMVGVLPLDVEQTRRPQGHGYVAARVDEVNPFLDCGAELRGHEFHYSKISGGSGAVRTVLALDRGVGVGDGRDGISVGGVVAGYTHLHALGVPEWAPALVRAARGGGR